MATKRKHTKPVGPDFPVYAERCGNCDHPQLTHMQAQAGTLTGRMQKCSAEGCGCDRWVGTWKSKATR